MTLYVKGGLTALRLYDIGYSIDLNKAKALLKGATRSISPRSAESINMPDPPLSLDLGSVMVAPTLPPVNLSARIYSFGTLTLRLHLKHPIRQAWSDYSSWALVHGPLLRDSREFDKALHNLQSQLLPAIERPFLGSAVEDYVIYRLTSLTNKKNKPKPASALSVDHYAGLLLGETKDTTPEARLALLGHRFSYYPNDLAAFAWDQALVLDPQDGETDVESMIEWGATQLLELRIYDEELDKSLQSMYDSIEQLRRRRIPNRWGKLLADVQETVVDTSEIVERVENALKFTDDIYLTRVYQAALDVFRVRTWRQSVDRKLRLMQDTSAMLNDQSQASRSEILEIIIVFLIFIEIILSFMH